MTRVEIPLRRSQRARRPILADDYVYLHENGFNIGKVNDRSSFIEATSCSE